MAGINGFGENNFGNYGNKINKTGQKAQDLKQSDVASTQKNNNKENEKAQISAESVLNFMANSALTKNLNLKNVDAKFEKATLNNQPTVLRVEYRGQCGATEAVGNGLAVGDIFKNANGTGSFELKEIRVNKDGEFVYVFTKGAGYDVVPASKLQDYLYSRM